MKTHRFEIVLALALLAVFAAFWWWQAPGASGKLSRSEVDNYIRKIEPRLPVDPIEKAEILARFRAWGETDDGEPVYMLNAMRYHAQFKKLPGVEGFQGTPAQANAHYEKIVTPIAVRLGAIPIVSGEAAGVRGSDGGAHTNLLAFEPKVDDWSRVLVMRYPSRRAFFDLVSDPAYLDVMPYKLASLDVALVPVRAELVVPDLRWIVGLILVAAFLVVGWRLAGRRHGGDL